MAGDDLKYASWIRRQPCAMCGRPGPCQVHHRTGSGMGLRAKDRDSMPLCAKCHGELHSLSGRFKDFDRERLREWQKAQVAVALDTHDYMHGQAAF